ncbi:hypothetical protein D3C81_510220 [compost metagenome]
MAEIATAPSSEVTVVLLGQGKADYCARAHYHYQQAGIPSVVVGSVSAGQAGEDLREQLQEVLQRIATPFVVLAMETDFVLVDALQGAVACLHEQSQALAAQGCALGFVVGNAKMKYHKLGSALPVSAEPGARARLLQYAQAGRQAWRAMVRRPALQAALASVPSHADVATFQLALSYAILALGEIAQLDQTDVLCAYEPLASSRVAREEQLNKALRYLRQHDAEYQALCVDDAGYAVLNQYVRSTYDHGEAPLLFTSSWSSVNGDPQRVFEPSQYVEMPYYNSALFAQLSAVEFICHAWPAGVEQYRALEGMWVRQHHLARVHANDTAESLQLRYWQAMVLGLFDPQICRQLVATLTGPDEGDRVRELNEWLLRLERIPGIAQLPRLEATPSGQLLSDLQAATPDAAALKRVQGYLANRSAGQIAFVVLDLANDDVGLQNTFDSVLASGAQGFKLVVLKAGKPPVITTARDTLHFIQVNDSNWVAHLNQVVRQLPSEWLLMLQAGDELLAGGLMQLLVELCESPACQAICANEVQRDEEGRMHAVVRPGADVNLLRSQAGLMSRHWLLRRQAVLDLGGYSETHRQALELDFLLRLVEAQGLSSLAHLDDYLVIGEQASPALEGEAVKVVSRHLTQLGYRAQLKEQELAGVSIDYRHDATPLVSILVASEGDAALLQACLTRVVQRTRYPRYEVLVVCADHEAPMLQGFGGRVRVLVGQVGESRSSWLNQAAGQALGDYLVLLSARCQVITPAWLEMLLNEAQRPEVGVVGALLQAADATLLHAGYALLDGPKVAMPWQGLSPEERGEARWSLSVRSCQAVSADCLMVSKGVFEHCGGLQIEEGADIDLCLAAMEAGQSVVWTPQAQLQVCAMPSASEGLAQALFVRWPSAFTGRVGSASTLDWLSRVE